MENKFNIIYRKLYKYFGPRGWWPVNGKYHPLDYEIPRNESQRLEICIGAILTQNTAWKNVDKVLSNLKRARVLTIDKLQKIELSELAQLIRPAGYFNEKAKKIKFFIEFVVNTATTLDKILSKEKNALRRELLNIWGIGKETADSIILYAGKQNIFVIDSYTKRIFVRHKLINHENLEYDIIRKLIEKNIEDKYQVYNEFHALIVECGKNFCFRKECLCEHCPLSGVIL
ncbi:MAG: hypothetical protein AB1765_11350 [Candidatus Hydrogenedentota bacterium]